MNAHDLSDKELELLMTPYDPVKDAPRQWDAKFKPNEDHTWENLSDTTKNAFIEFYVTFIKETNKVDPDNKF